MGLEGPRHSSAGNGLHHRRFHFDKIMFIQVTPQRLNQLAALEEDLTHLRIHYQIHVTLAIA